MNETIVYRAASMSWEEIVRDRLKRGLDVDAADLPPLAPSACTPIPAAPRKRNVRKVVTRLDRLGTANDPRLPSNTAAHFEAPYTGPAPRTQAAASKIRREVQSRCPCRLCALALHPPQTFEEATRFGFGAAQRETLATYGESTVDMIETEQTGSEPWQGFRKAGT